MSEVFINKVRAVILENFQDENFNVQKLASILGLSRSQILRKVKASTGKSINQFIKEIRLNESVKLIKNGEYTCAEIAYKVGFSSPQYFSKCFHKFYGYTPGECKNMELPDVLPVQNAVKEKQSKILKIIISSLVLISLMFLGYQFIEKKTILNKTIKMHSIAVLPFDDLSKESDSEWFCDGVTDEILSHLSKIKGLRVISKTSTNHFKNSDKTIPEIAKELGVNYIVEGSVRKHKNNVLITAKLFKATDEHIWASKYNEKLDDIFKIQNDVSKKIVQQLKIAISPEEEKALDENPTDNIEAYQLFLKGRAISDSRTKEDLGKSIELYKRAIFLDSNYAEAYAEIAYSYLLLSGYGYMSNGDAKKEIKTFTDKALQIKPNTVRAYSTLASIYCRDGNYEKSKKNFEKSIALNPNDATAHHLFADFFENNHLFDAKNWLIQISIAQKLDPSSMPINNDLIRALLQNGKIKEAENHFNKMKFLFTPIVQLQLSSTIRSIKNKDRTETIRMYEKALEKEPENDNLRLNLALKYNTITNDYEKMLFHIKKVYDANPQKLYVAQRYFYALLYNKRFSEAKELVNNPKFMALFSDEMKAWLFLDYHFYKDEFDKALEYIEKLKSNKYYYYNKACIYAKKGAIKKTYEALNYVPKDVYKAIVFANLKEKDSMYYYLNKMTHYTRIEFANGAPEFAPYRNEPRYQAFLKKNYFPVLTN